ncbi:MAG: amidohydrolase, partial [Terriglobia bacterium]
MNQRIRMPALILGLLFFVAPLLGQEDLEALITRELSSIVSTYKYLHSHPELSYREKETARYLAEELRGLGFEVTEKVGDYGVPDRTS